MREYIRPGFAQEKAAKDIKRLQAILQALRNCHQSLDLMGSNDLIFSAQQDIQSAYQHVALLLKNKQARQPGEIASPLAINTEFVD